MANGYNGTDNYALSGATASGVVTDQVVSKPFPITAGGSLNIVLKIVVAGVTHVGTQTLKLQTGLNDDWVDSKTATFTANGNTYIKLQTTAAGDQTYLPLLSSGRLVISQTNAGDAATVSSVQVLQAL